DPAILFKCNCRGAPAVPPTYSIGESLRLCSGSTTPVPLPSIPRKLMRSAVWVLASVVVLATTAILTALTARSDEPTSDSVGTIDGAAIAVSGPMRVEVVKGFARTVLRSGSDVSVKSGTARLDLTDGGTISICGPAHFSVLKSGNLLTVALDTGTIHISLEHGPALTIYTPLLQIQPIAIGDGPQDALVGFDATGAMCVRAYRGAVRLEQQFTSQNIVVPQSSDVLLVNGQLDGLRAGGDRCSCDPELTKYIPPPRLEVVPPPASTEEATARPMGSGEIVSPLPLEKPAAKEGPIYEIFVPPLIYNASAEAQPEVDMSMLMVVRRVRVRPTLIFQGRVEGDLTTSRVTDPAPAPKRPAATTPPKAAPQGSDSVVGRVVHFVRKLWSRGS
ncbi:MAG TPA: hypothetical protein VNB49_06375, partial [Candidatus Dormibacteraeota bacterium]|nr:hypothetical protein [Candidatus Dormibacteraeota bacterium]